jgi:hypothetical protein
VSNIQANCKWTHTKNPHAIFDKRRSRLRQNGSSIPYGYKDLGI